MSTRVYYCAIGPFVLRGGARIADVRGFVNAAALPQLGAEGGIAREGQRRLLPCSTFAPRGREVPADRSRFSVSQSNRSCYSSQNVFNIKLWQTGVLSIHRRDLRNLRGSYFRGMQFPSAERAVQMAAFHSGICSIWLKSDSFNVPRNSSHELLPAAESVEQTVTSSRL